MGRTAPTYRRGYKREKLTVITTYGIILRDIDFFLKHYWNCIILDEAHAIKNENTSIYKCIQQLQSQFRLCLTGTPIENNLFELKSLYDFLMPNYFGSKKIFKQKFSDPICQKEDKQKENILKKLIHPFKLRRSKSEVLAELPKKIEDIRYCQLSEYQNTLYKEVLQKDASHIIEQIQSSPNNNLPYFRIFRVIQKTNN